MKNALYLKKCKEKSCILYSFEILARDQNRKLRALRSQRPSYSHPWKNNVFTYFVTYVFKQALKAVQLNKNNLFTYFTMRRPWLSGCERAYYTKGPWFEPMRGHYQDFGLSASASVDLVCHLGRSDATSFRWDVKPRSSPCSIRSIKHIL